ncbi:NADH:flavin oxidoreductase/NADH oxidase [Tropicibacter sp. Alg240-R139]|uniref:NADH:flavin oxidoreductase/NADH oxidase n=1 Tax=Tropicibacter sp. Alg240-R139 TaxID=2305991 RepID=UPI0013E02CF6|nr:NADH:flavin oxidoreductase/NADH oxidase [Tropicibacter sp. Alg240-R139]
MTSQLFSSAKLRGLTLNNRIVVSPMAQYQAKDGNVNDWHLMHYGSLSMGAAGLVISEMTDVSEVGRVSYECAGLYNDDNEAAWKRIVDFVKAKGVAKFGVQLGHAGRKGSTVPPAKDGLPLTEEQGAWETIAPSAIPFAETWHTPREATTEDMAEIKQQFVDAVIRADRVGFDLVELHAGHGYLINQFLSPITNRRTDEYGGSLENRMRFPLEVFEAMRAAWPEDKPMGARVSATDWVEGEGFTPEEATQLALELKTRGIEYVDISGGGLDPRQKPPFGVAYQASMAEQVRAGADITTMTVGLIADPHVAEDLIASGKTDFVKIAREALYNPRWAWHAAVELGEETQYPGGYFAAQPKFRPWVFQKS